MWVRFPPGPDLPLRRLSRGAAISLALHAVVLALLLWEWSGGPQPESSPSPSEVAMVFQSGSRNAASARAPTARPAPAAPPHIATAPPLSEPPHQVPAPVPMPAFKPPAAPLPVPPHLAPAPNQVTHLPATSASPRPRAGRPSATKFPAPIMRNFFIPSGAAPTAAHPFSDSFARGDRDARRGSERDTPFDLRGAERLGPDWSDEFMEWVEEHKRYPEQAAANGEDGDSTVQMTIDRYGRVTSVRIVQRSGSVWLDAGLTGMFRDAHLPPFPPGTPDRSLPVTFTMHYMLIR